MIDENYSIFTKTGPNKSNYKPDEPEITEKREKREREREREKKRLATVFSFYSLDFGQCLRSLTDPYTERSGFHKSRCVCVYIYIYKHPT